MAVKAETALRLDCIVNFRDFGGHDARDGRRVVWGRLFRSGHHAEATKADLASLAGLELGLIVDLRRPAERRRLPSRRSNPSRRGLSNIEGRLRPLYLRTWRSSRRPTSPRRRSSSR
jgi:hypothetical protein